MSEMKRPVLDFADVLYPGIRDKRVSECTPEESIVSGIAWIADNEGFGVKNAAMKLIDEFRALMRSHGPNDAQDIFKTALADITAPLLNHKPGEGKVLDVVDAVFAAMKKHVSVLTILRRTDATGNESTKE